MRISKAAFVRLRGADLQLSRQFVLDSFASGELSPCSTLVPCGACRFSRGERVPLLVLFLLPHIPPARSMS